MVDENKYSNKLIPFGSSKHLYSVSINQYLTKNITLTIKRSFHIQNLSCKTNFHVTPIEVKWHLSCHASLIRTINKSIKDCGIHNQVEAIEGSGINHFNLEVYLTKDHVQDIKKKEKTSINSKMQKKSEKYKKINK